MKSETLSVPVTTQNIRIQQEQLSHISSRNFARPRKHMKGLMTYGSKLQSKFIPLMTINLVAASEFPASFTANTRNSYSRPSMRPIILYEVEAIGLWLHFCHMSLPTSFFSIKYPRMPPPPSDSGRVQFKFKQSTFISVTYTKFSCASSV